jgi:hypothetical protein
MLLLLLCFDVGALFVFVCRPISAENKGHRMLAKMGWKEGSGLGKDNAGRAEPVSTCTVIFFLQYLGMAKIVFFTQIEVSSF